MSYSTTVERQPLLQPSSLTVFPSSHGSPIVGWDHAVGVVVQHEESVSWS